MAIAGGLMIAGAVGSAVAMSPIVQPPIKWAGGAEFSDSVLGGVPSPHQVMYTVPAGRNFILTDLIVSNLTGTAQSFSVHTGAGGSCNTTLTLRLLNISVLPSDTSYVSLQTGIGFTSGQAVCVQATAVMPVSGRGFLFTAAPAS